MRPTMAVIDLGAVRHNLTVARANGAPVAAVVKANAYGHGAARVLPALRDADKLAVCCLDEAQALRAAGAEQPIVLLEGPFSADELPLAARLACEVVVHEPGQVRMLETARLDRPLAVWLKIDTGMRRLGVDPADAAPLYGRLAALDAVGALGLMTHLARADEPGDRTTRHQLDRFAAVTARLPGPRSIANSAGLLAWPGARGQLTRPGIMLWGASPFADRAATVLGLRPAMTLRSTVISARQVRRGEPVGYGADWLAPTDTAIGIVAIGYGDGYPRHAPSGTPVLVGDRYRPLAGRVSMDMIAVDLGPGSEVAVGEPVTLWGQGLPVDLVAAYAGTVAYELLCGVTARVAVTVIDAPPAGAESRSAGSTLLG